MNFLLESIIQDGINEQFHSNDCRLESIIGVSRVWGLYVAILSLEGKVAMRSHKALYPLSSAFISYDTMKLQSLPCAVSQFSVSCRFSPWSICVGVSNKFHLFLCAASMLRFFGSLNPGPAWIRFAPSALTRPVMPWRLNHGLKILILMQSPRENQAEILSIILLSFYAWTKPHE